MKAISIRIRFLFDSYVNANQDERGNFDRRACLLSQTDTVTNNQNVYVAYNCGKDIFSY